MSSHVSISPGSLLEDFRGRNCFLLINGMKKIKHTAKGRIDG